MGIKARGVNLSQFVFWIFIHNVVVLYIGGWFITEIDHEQQSLHINMQKSIS